MGRSLFSKLVLACGVAAIFGLFSSASAMQFSSTDYLIDAAVLNNTGGFSSSTDYQLTSSGGEAAIGNGASGSYLMPAGYVAQLQSMISVKTEPSGLVGYWPLDEGSGTETYDASANANNGVLINAPTWGTGKVGADLTFNGTSQAVDLGNPTESQITNGTVELWMKSTQTSGQVSMASKGSSWWVGLDNGMPAIYDWTTSNTCIGTTNIADGNWHQVAVSLQSGVTNGSIIYVDGVQNQTCTWTTQSQTGKVVFAAAQGGSPYQQYYTGSLDQVKLFNRVLSPQEIAAEYAAQSAGLETGLTLQTIIPGASNSSAFEVLTQSTAGGYNLAINENHNLQDGSNTIPAISGTITSPIAWNEGTTKGFGFTLTGTNATPIAASWGNGSNYAALPLSATTFYTRTGTQSSPDVVTMQLRADAATSQASGSYTNTMTITGTANL